VTTGPRVFRRGSATGRVAALRRIRLLSLETKCGIPLIEVPNDPLRFHPHFSDDLRDALSCYDSFSSDVANRLRAAENAKSNRVVGIRMR